MHHSKLVLHDSILGLLGMLIRVLLVVTKIIVGRLMLVPKFGS